MEVRQLVTKKNKTKQKYNKQYKEIQQI